MRLAAFCEAAADFQIASDLIDRVLRETGPGWVAHVIDDSPDEIRTWHEEQGRSFFAIHDLTKHIDRLSARVQHGHFDGKPGVADSMTGRNVAAIARALGKQGHHIDAVVIVRDLDDQPQRRDGLKQARVEARAWATFPIVLGWADPKREAWVLCGFDPTAPVEHARLAELRRELGFQANVEPNRLSAKDKQAKTNAKRVLYALTEGDWDREQRCWTHTPLELLKARGELTGLTAFLVEIETHLVPLLGPPR